MVHIIQEQLVPENEELTVSPLVTFLQCTVPENIHTSPMEGFFRLLPPTPQKMLHTFSLTFLVFSRPPPPPPPPSPMEIFWNWTMGQCIRFRHCKINYMKPCLEFKTASQCLRSLYSYDRLKHQLSLHPQSHPAVPGETCISSKRLWSEVRKKALLEIQWQSMRR